MRIPPLLAALFAVSLAACNESNSGPPAPPAEDLLTFVFFHVDPAHPGTTQAPPLPPNTKIEKTSNCHYQISWDDPAGTFTQRTQYNVAFQPTSRLRIEPDPPGYRQHIDGAAGTLTMIDVTKNQMFDQKYNASYDDLVRNNFPNDGLADRAVTTFQTFIKNYCTSTAY